MRPLEEIYASSISQMPLTPTPCFLMAETGSPNVPCLTHCAQGWSWPMAEPPWVLFSCLQESLQADTVYSLCGEQTMDGLQRPPTMHRPLWCEAQGFLARALDSEGSLCPFRSVSCRELPGPGKPRTTLTSMSSPELTSANSDQQSLLGKRAELSPR